MNKSQNYKSCVVMLWIIILQLACNPSENSTTKTVSEEGQNSDQNSLLKVKNTGVRFQYEFGETKEWGDNFLIDIKCIIINQTGKEINYICQSCNGLEYFLILQPESYQVQPWINCYATWGMICKLSPKDSFEFKTQILKVKNTKPIEKVGLDFRTVNKFIPFDRLREKPELIESIYRAKTESKDIIWGKKY